MMTSGQVGRTTRLHTKYRCPVTLLVICPYKTTARWARKPIEIGPAERACLTMRPFVLGPDNVPAVTELAQAQEDVAFAVLSALTHGRTAQAGAILETLSTALDSLDIDAAVYFAEFAEAGLGKTVAGKTWNGLMATQTYKYQSQLRTEGKVEGRAEGEARGRAASVLRVLEQRGVHVPSTVYEQVMACTDPDTLENWLDRSLTATSVEDLFASADG